MSIKLREQVAKENRLGRLLATAPINDRDLSYKINCLPDWLRAYIHDIETRCDPAGEVRDLYCHKQATEALQRKCSQLQEELESAHGGGNYGDVEEAAAKLEETRSNLRALPDKRFRELFDLVHKQLGCYVQKDSCVNYPNKPWCVIDVDGLLISRGETPMVAMAECERAHGHASTTD